MFRSAVQLPSTNEERRRSPAARGHRLAEEGESARWFARVVDVPTGLVHGEEAHRLRRRWTPDHTSGAAVSGQGGTLSAFVAVTEGMMVAARRFDAACVPAPDWEALALPGRAVLARAQCSSWPVAAVVAGRRLSGRLRQLPVAHSESAVRSVLHGHSCFCRGPPGVLAARVPQPLNGPVPGRRSTPAGAVSGTSVVKLHFLSPTAAPTGYSSNYRNTSANV